MQKYRVRIVCVGLLSVGDTVYPYTGFAFGAVEEHEIRTGKPHCAVTRDPSGRGNEFFIVPTSHLERIDPYQDVRPLL